MSGEIFKGLGIIISYLWLLIAFYVFEWTPFSVFFAHILEFLIVILIFTISDFVKNFSIEAQAKRPTQNILMIGLMLAGFQTIGAGVVCARLDDNSFFEDPNAVFDSNNLITAIWISIIYIVRIVLLSKSKNHNVHMVIEENILFQGLTLSGMTIVGCIFLAIFGDSAAFWVITCVIASRIGMEYYFNKEIHII